jgi:hypothetical protein
MSSGRIRTNLSSYAASISKISSLPSSTVKPQIGKVYGVVTTEDTPTKELFESIGSYNSIGAIFYRNYYSSKEVIEDLDNVAPLSPAFPLFPQIQNIPLIGELVYLIELPSPISQAGKNKSNVSGNQKYYITINVWNNVQQNSLPTSEESSLGSTIIENPNIRSLLPFQGDYIIQGRQGNSLRLSTTTKTFNNLNEWSAIGNDYDPITVLTNGLAFDPKKQYYVEQINKDNSSIYLTSTQKIPLQTDKNGTLNNLTNPLDAPDYFNSQVILNADRITLNSKKDEVMIFAKTNVEINTKNIINLNADERIHLNSNNIILGPYNINTPAQPLLLGDNTYELLESLLDSLYNLGLSLSTVIGSPEGAPAVDINNAAGSLLNDLDRINDKLGGILSQQNFTV